MLNENRMLFYFICDKLSLNCLENIYDENRKGDKVKIWKEKRITANELRNDIIKSNDLTYPNHTFITYELDKNFYKHYNIFAKRYEIIPKNKKNPIEILFTHIYIHLFKTGICFLDLGYSVKSESSQDFLNCNYFMSEMKANVKIQLVNYTWDSENEKHNDILEEITTIDFIKRILVDFDKIYTLDYKEDLKYLYSKPILFSYLFLDKGKTEVKDFENISHNFKSSYKLNNEIITKSQYFENSIWYYSSSSVSNISYALDDKETNDFFKTTFKDKISNLYFLLFLHSFHQKVYLLLTSMRIRSYKFKCSSACELSLLSDEILVFKQNLEEIQMNVFFQYPSSIDHHNIFYDNMQKQFNIQGLSKMLNADLTNLEKYLANNTAILTKYKTAVGEIRKTIMDIILLLIASLVSFASLYDTFMKLLKNLKIELSLTANIIYAILFIVICLILPTIINISKNLKKIRSNKNELKRIDSIVKKEI